MTDLLIRKVRKNDDSVTSSPMFSLSGGLPDSVGILCLVPTLNVDAWYCSLINFSNTRMFSSIGAHRSKASELDGSSLVGYLQSPTPLYEHPPSGVSSTPVIYPGYINILLAVGKSGRHWCDKYMVLVLVVCGT